MLLFIGGGGLGNQVFQYLAIRSRLGEGTLGTSSLQTLDNVFSNTKTVRIPKAAETILRLIIGPLLLKPLFKWLRLGTYCYEPMGLMSNGSCGPSGDMVVQQGLLPVTYIDGGFYQNLSELLSPADFRRLRLREDVLVAARAVVNDALRGRPWPKAVMHVRRGDYLLYSYCGVRDVLLPVAYFQRAAAAAREYFGPDAELLVVTDDPSWCELALAEMQPFTVVSSSEAVDFALLSMFPVALLSNSTFSLAAACVGPDVERVIGPRYWLGHAVKQWYPPRIEARDKRFIYI
jgi:hypothetical protein